MNWRERIARLLIRIGYRFLKVDMLGASYRLVGIDMGPSFETSSEYHIMKTVIFKVLPSSSLVLDIGANTGGYSGLLSEHFDQDMIHSFEPNPNCAQGLRDKLKNDVHSIAIGSESGRFSFYRYKDDLHSEHGSIRRESLFLDKEIEEVEVKVVRLDDFIKDNQLPTPSFVKIDTEGNDLEVIKGMGELKNKIKFIQFEFNDMYVYSRVFLRDFYEELEGFNLYRIGRNGLVDISIYSPFYEVFRYQNILAVNKTTSVQLPIDF